MKNVLERAIIIMHKLLFPDGKGSYLTDELNSWSDFQVKKFNMLIIELFVSVRNDGDLKSAKYI